MDLTSCVSSKQAADDLGLEGLPWVSQASKKSRDGSVVSASIHISSPTSRSLHQRELDPVGTGDRCVVRLIIPGIKPLKHTQRSDVFKIGLLLKRTWVTAASRATVPRTMSLSLSPYSSGLSVDRRSEACV